MAKEPEGKKSVLVGGTLYVEGATVTVSRDCLVLDVNIDDVDGAVLETLCVKINGQEAAHIPIG